MSHKEKMLASGATRLAFMMLVVFSAVITTLVAVSWRPLYSQYLEPVPPEIEVLEMPRGVGLLPASMKFQLSDKGAGLDEVVIRTRQRNQTKERLRQDLGGRSNAIVNLDFPGQDSGLVEGTVEVEVRVFDRSFWNNSNQKVFSLRVDYRKPRLEVLSPQHNARAGGSQLVFYRAEDEGLAPSGVKVGEQRFLGYPARGLDREFQDPALFAALYAIDIRESVDPSSVRAFAEDQVGNQTTQNFYNRVQARTRRTLNVKLTENFLRDSVVQLAGQYEDQLREAETEASAALAVQGLATEQALLVSKFKAVNETLRKNSESELANLFTTTRFESYWQRSFLMPIGSVQATFGDSLVYSLDGRELGRSLSTGYEVVLSNSFREVVAANDGIVLFAEQLGTFGRCLGIDHGLGLASVYGHLDQILIRKGESVARGQKIALAGNTGFSRNTNLYFEMRLHGVPVDPVEWWEDSWYYAHITAKINDIKKMLGIPVYSPLG